RLSDEQRFLVLCVVTGLLCGLAAVAFHFAIHHLFEALWHFASHSPPLVFTLTLLLAPTLAGLAVGLVVTKIAPDAAGSGIPQTKVAYHNRGGKISTFTGLWRFVIGSLYVGLGNSLGREGPTVHVSAAISSRIGRWAFRDPRRVQAMLPVGMAAGIAAAFNAPLSALTFVFEELLDNFSMKALGGMVVAVVIAAAVSRTILGEDPILDTHLISDYATSPWMLVAIPLGITAGLLGHLFSSSVLKLRELNRRSPLPRWLSPALGGLSCGILGLIAWHLTAGFGQAQNSIFSIGYESLELAFENKLAIAVLALLLLFKTLAVIINYASGGSGGLFSPTLYLGGMLGGLVGAALAEAHEVLTWLPAFPADDKVIGACVLLGMGAMFSAVVRCPFTSLIIIFELTGNYSLILPLMAGNILAYSFAKKLGPSSIYTALIMQDGITLRSFPAYRGAQDYRKLPLQAIMTHDPFTLPYQGSTGHSLALVNGTRQRYHAYPIVDIDNQLKGVITLHELREHPPETKISELIGAQELLSFHPDTSIREAARAMIEHDYQQAPVVSKSSPTKLLGWITMNDIARQQNAVE
ncbi:MAG: chloride channel protein, partial [Verrucomicrobiales bacterium]